MIKEQDLLLNGFKIRGVIEKGHFVLSSGKHSDTYFNKAKIYNDPQFTKLLADFLAEDIMDACLGFHTIVSPAMGGLIIGSMVATEIYGTNFAWTERNKFGIMELKRFELSSYENILIVDDVITTGLSVKETIDALEDKHRIAGIACIVNRSDMVNINCIPIISLLDYYTPLYEEDNLPDSLKAIPAVKPGSR